MKSYSLNTKIVFWTGICIACTAITLVGYSSWKLRSNTLKLAHSTLYTIAHERSTVIEQSIASALDTGRTLAQVLSKVHDSESPLDIPRYEASQLVRSILEENSHFLSAFTCWEPLGYDYMDDGYKNEEGHDGTGRFAPLWRKEASGQVYVQPLLLSKLHTKDGKEGSWYTTPKAKKSSHVYGPTFDEENDRWFVTVTVPVIAQDTFHGVMGIDLDLTPLQNSLLAADLYEGKSEIAIISQEAVYIAGSSPDHFSGRKLSPECEEHGFLLDHISNNEEYFTNRNEQFYLLLPVPLSSSDSIWNLLFVVPVHSLTKEITTLMWKQISLLIGILVIMLPFSFLGTRQILNQPLSLLLEGVRKVSKGDLDHEVNVASADEIGTIAVAFNTMRIKLKEMVNTLEQHQFELEDKVAQRTKDLELKNEEIEEHRFKLQKALDEISALIQAILEEGGSLDVFFENPAIQACWEKMHCEKPECPCYGKDPMRCWQVDDTLCYDNKCKETFREKFIDCQHCAIVKEATNDPLQRIGEHFNNMIVMLQINKKELDKAHQQLLQSQKMESVGQLAAGIAHEINTPAQFVGSNLDFLADAFTDIADLIDKIQKLAVFKEKEHAEILEEALEDADWDYLTDEFPQALQQSKDGVERISSIVLAMKDFSHPASKEMTPTNLNKLISTTMTVARNEWKYVAAVTTELDEDLPQVPLLTDQMGQVILNTLVNAAHAVGARYNNDPDQGAIKIITSQVESSAQIIIEDNGTGMPEDVRSKIFDPFFTTKEVGKGTGQGLSIAYDIVVNKHGGELECTSEDGKGSSFIITLPLELPEKNADPE